MVTFVDISRVLAMCSSLVMISSPMPSIIRIYRTKTTAYASIVPLVSMVLNLQLLMIYGYLSEQYFPVFSTFVIGEVLSIGYTTVFYYFSHEKAKAHKVFLLYGIPYISLSTYALLGGFGVTNQTRHQVGQIIGYFSIVTNIVVFSSPLEKIGPVLKHRSAVFFNIQMICAGTFCNVMWVIYSSLVRQWILFAPNAFSLVSGCVEISLYWIFHPSTHPMSALPVTTSVAALADAVESPTAPTKHEDTDEDDASADENGVTHVCVVAIDEADKPDKAGEDNTTCFIALASPHSSRDSIV